MSEENRQKLLRSLWFMSALTLGAILIGAIGLGGPTAWLITLSIAVLSLAAIGTAAILRLDDGYAIEKAKRRDINRMLREMTDNDLYQLRQRLSDEHSVRQLGEDNLYEEGEIAEISRVSE